MYFRAHNNLEAGILMNEMNVGDPAPQTLSSPDRRLRKPFNPVSSATFRGLRRQEMANRNPAQLTGLPLTFRTSRRAMGAQGSCGPK